MTEDKGEEDVLAVVKTTPGNHVRDHYSQRQIDVIKNEIIPKYVTDVAETGIIAPYKNQIKALEKEFKDIDAATVHKFQGKEKDTIIISTVYAHPKSRTAQRARVRICHESKYTYRLLIIQPNQQTSSADNRSRRMGKP